MGKREEILTEIRRVAEKLGVKQLARREFARHSRVSASTVRDTFASWNRAVQEAGLEPIVGHVPLSKKIPDSDLLQEVIRLTQELGKKPSAREMAAFGQYSKKPYIKRWGSFVKARDLAYRKLGFPEIATEATGGESVVSGDKPGPTELVIPPTHKPKERRVRKKIQFGEPIDFRGLRFAPVNEQGVVYLFGMISRELGFLIESIRTEYPDCEGKRRVSAREGRWEHVLIEFEYKSSRFQEHGHSPDKCDLIVCWIHDWEDCPLEVLELKSIIKLLD